jgi:hypothetical protein
MVRDRKSLIDMPQYSYLYKNTRTRYVFAYPPFESAEGVSWFRRLLGDRAISLIALPIGAPPEERARVRTLFPEAKVMAYIPPYTSPKSHFPDEFVPFPDEESSDRSAGP